MKQYDEHIIDAYLRGELSPTEKAELEAAILKDDELKEWFEFQQNLQLEVKRSLKNRLLEQLQVIEQELEMEKKQADSQPLYTLEELLSMFKVVEHYEYAIESLEEEITMRSSELGVIHPVNELDTNGVLVFELQKEVDVALELVIENNEEEVLIEEDIPPQCRFFTVDIEGFAIGRYYWKLMSDVFPVIVGAFFVGKRWMPM